jgi:hypothetical protein
MDAWTWLLDEAPARAMREMPFRRTRFRVAPGVVNPRRGGLFPVYEKTVPILHFIAS